MRPLLLTIGIFISLLSRAQVQADILIKNGRVLDGTGNSWYYADVAIKDGRILKIGQLDNYTAAKVIDAKQSIVSPGFIDVHTHIEGDEFRNPTADNFILDGVTTVVTGNCGSSHTDIKRYFWRLDSLKTSVNVATLLGHNDVRRAVMGMVDRDPTEEELKKMEAIAEQAMIDGAVGLSTGLIYTPGTYSKTSEILRLAQVASRYKGLYASHMRSEGDSIVAAINEALYIGRTAGMPVQISHFKISGQQNWGSCSLSFIESNPPARISSGIMMLRLVLLAV